jgi:hypothetical protein
MPGAREALVSQTPNRNTMSFIAFLIAAIVLAITPGPGVA